MGFSDYVQRQIDTILMPHWIRTWWDFVWSWFTLNRVVSLATIFATIFLSRPRNYFPIEFKNPVVIFLVQLCVYISSLNLLNLKYHSMHHIIHFVCARSCWLYWIWILSDVVIEFSELFPKGLVTVYCYSNGYKYGCN